MSKDFAGSLDLSNKQTYFSKERLDILIMRSSTTNIKPTAIKIIIIGYTPIEYACPPLLINVKKEIRINNQVIHM